MSAFYTISFTVASLCHLPLLLTYILLSDMRMKGATGPHSSPQRHTRCGKSALYTLMWPRNQQALLTSQQRRCCSKGTADSFMRNTRNAFCISDRTFYSLQVTSRTNSVHILPAVFIPIQWHLDISHFLSVAPSSSNRRTGLSLFQQDICVSNFTPPCTGW